MAYTAVRRRRFDRLQDLGTIAEGVIDVEALVARQELVLGHLMSSVDAPSTHSISVADLKGNMGLGRRRKAPINPEVELQVASFEPDATSRPQIVGLFDFLKSEHIPIEASSCVLATRRNRDLDVVYRRHGHADQLPTSSM